MRNIISKHGIQITPGSKDHLHAPAGSFNLNITYPSAYLFLPSQPRTSERSNLLARG